MSFADISRGTRRSAEPGFRGPVGRGAGSSSLEDRGVSNGIANGLIPSAPAASTTLRDAVLQYHSQVQLYEKLVRSLGTAKDKIELRSNLRAQEFIVKEVGQRVETSAGLQLQAVESLPKSDKDRIRAEINKMHNDTQRLKAKFDNLVRATANRIRELDLGIVSRVESSTEPSPDGQQSLQLLMQQDDIDEQILQEREAEILAINRSAVKVNEIFRDLGELIQRQQEDVDAIEQNVMASHASAKQGLEQVEKAARYQPGCTIS